MKKTFTLVLFSFLSLCCGNLFAQVEDDILQILEDLDISSEQAEDLLQSFQDKKQRYNINSLTIEDMVLLGLTNAQIFNLQNYIRRTGQIFSVNELKFVNTFDSLTIQRISPYLYAQKVPYIHSLRLDSIMNYSKQSLRLNYAKNLKTPYGFTRDDKKGFVGSNFSSTFRYKLAYYDRLEFSLVGDKDYGEPIYYKNKTYGYDHYSISLTIRDLSKYLKQLTIGDYRLNLGEGLAMKQNFSINYLSDSYGAKHTNNNITPFRSSLEYGYNTGLATKWDFGKIELVAFASYNAVDFNGKSVQQTGYHRTESEIENKNSNTLTMGGLHLNYFHRGLTFGFTSLLYHYDKPIIHGTQKYQQYYFSGNDNNILALNVAYNYKNCLFFSEIAKSKNNAFSELLGVQVSLGYKSSLSFLVRNYDKRYQNIYADAIGYHSGNQNERGFYFDYSKYVSKRFSYFLAGDIYYFPYPSYRADEPSYGYKAKAQVEYSFNKHIFDFYFRLNNHQYNVTLEDKTKAVKDNIVSQYQLRYRYVINECLTFAIRVGYSHSFTYASKKNNGYFGYAELLYKPSNNFWNFNMRYTYFHTSDYDNRFYVYEYNLPLAYSSAMLYNTGHRIYANVCFDYFTDFTIYFRYIFIRYSNTKEISSGNTRIDGNIQHYLSAQLLYKIPNKYYKSRNKLSIGKSMK